MDTSLPTRARRRALVVLAAVMLGGITLLATATTTTASTTEPPPPTDVTAPASETPPTEPPATEPPATEAPTTTVVGEVATVEVLEEIPVVAAAEDDFGASSTEYYAGPPPPYGTPYTISVYVNDASASCENLPFDCDNPAGTVDLYVDGQLAASGTLTAGALSDYSSVNIEITPDSGRRLIEARYVPGNFDSSSVTFDVDIPKADCTATLAGGGDTTIADNVVFIPSVASSSGTPRDGTLTMRLGDGTVLREVTPFGPTAFVGVDNIPVGSQQVYFDFSGGPNHNPCSSNQVNVIVHERMVATADRYTVAQNELLSFDPTVNDVVEPLVTPVVITGPTNGSAGPVLTGGLYYQPSSGFVGTDTLTYTITNGAGQSASATVTFDVVAPLAALDDTATTSQDESVTVEVLANDTTPDPNSYVVIAQEPAHGTVVVNDDNTVTYTPDSGYSGTDTFDYQVFDNIRPAATATVTVTVEAEPPVPTTPSSTTTTSTTTTTTSPATPGEPARNGSPVVGADSYSVTAGEILVVGSPGVLANDSDPDGDELVATLAGDAEHGALVLNPDGSFAYTPEAGFVGTDSFSYAASDGASATMGFAGQSRMHPAAVSAPTTVTITVDAAPAPAVPVIPAGQLPAAH